MVKPDPHKADDEPAVRTFLIDKMNNIGARSRRLLTVRLPQTLHSGHILLSKHAWTSIEQQRYYSNGSLPYTYDATSAEHRTNRSQCVPLWIFDASTTRGQLPVVDLDHPASFGANKELCLLLLRGINTPGTGSPYALVPTKVLDFVEKEGRKVQLVFKDPDLSTEDFTSDKGGDWNFLVKGLRGLAIGSSD